jgi:hypothetical protein
MAVKRLYNKLIFAPQQASSTILDSYVRISDNEVRELKSKAQTIRVVTGWAWVSYRGEDHVLKVGDEMTLAAGRNLAYISALGERPLTYEVVNSK